MPKYKQFKTKTSVKLSKRAKLRPSAKKRNDLLAKRRTRPVKPTYLLVAGLVLVAVLSIPSLLGSDLSIASLRPDPSVSTAPSVTQEGSNFPAQVEKWRSTVETACNDSGLDVKWTDTVLAMMQAESGGNLNVYSVVGADNDIMQAGEGLAGVTAGRRNVVELGESALYAWDIDPSLTVNGDTATSSIYAGVLETKQNVDLFEGWLGDIDVDDTGKIGLIAQGYNYGADGWFKYCKARGITSWDYYDSKAYQNIQSGGTAMHGGKVITFYNTARSDGDDA